ncbi:putative deoxyribodipyrimidine photolyase [Prochlorococcus marinus str. MIT 9515]|uniref:Putative deoxyribodipyrimidine photolyase n=1 Tax=Prochlorococcus marinus (strain MIT 9515) TaxID=167542 RepID=A2BUZ7_PROM5|nr:deoxyribodipyrimidine photo-lyase [Prochlorococcus marinus]ABM71608.1 putative deoxyribodipyrimidine photolyase [Prochlorococcus marinus str. MIT 9515]
MKNINILWFKKDLRINDNEALIESLKDRDIIPIFIIEKEIWSQKTYSDRQWQFCKESLLDLRISLANIGQPLIIRTGKVIEIFDQISNNFEIKAIYSHQETGDYLTYKRDQEVRKWASMKKIIWKEYLQFSVFRGKLDRNNWSTKWKKNMERKLFTEPSKINPIEIDPGEIPPDNFFCFKDDFCKGRLKGGREIGLKRMEYFFSNKLSYYSKDISSPEKSFDSCSRLSPYISWGCISIKEIIHKANSITNPNSKMLKSRLTWHCHFIQKLESEPELEFKEFHPYFQKIRKKDSHLLKLWSEGKTGFPFLDACMRSLNFHGWLNFRMRAMLMSFASYNLWIPWQESGSELASKFLDYEPGIHWNQCQMQAGTTSINVNRIYNPIKQGKDHDPKGNFIKKWVPEIQNYPENFVHEPWLMEKFNSKEYENSEYIKPIINLSETTKNARKRIQEITQREGYWDISKGIYMKHGSRRKALNKRKNYPKKSNLRKKRELQNQLNLDLLI